MSRTAIWTWLFLIFSAQGIGQINYGVTWYDSPTEGYNLFSPTGSRMTYLIDNCGRVVNSWVGKSTPGVSAYLSKEGSLVRTETLQLGNIGAGGVGGRIHTLDWDGNTTWEFNFSSDNLQAHHDIEVMPNGNVLVLSWEARLPEDAINSGRHDSLVNPVRGIWSEAIYELQPTGLYTADTVWEWHLWDHLIQDIDSTLINFGIVKDNPQRYNINNNPTATLDWMHMNHIDYHVEKDLILLSSRNADEIYIIDHSTTSVEAARDQGGKYGRGGDFLFRWGNPSQYNSGNENDQQLNGQHDAHWLISNDRQTDSILIFNNGFSTRPSESAVYIIEPKELNFEFLLDTIGRYLPSAPLWKYSSPDIFSTIMSGAQWLENNHFMITRGISGEIMEFDQDGNLVWSYRNPAGRRIRAQTSDVSRSADLYLFKSEKYPIDFDGFNGRSLEPKEPIETLSLPILCETTSISQSKEKKNWILSPNPNNGLFKITVEDGGWNILRICNAFGPVMPPISFRNSTQIDGLDSGIYFLQLNGKAIVKVVVQ